MGRALYKVGENEYVEFSSIVDDAVTWVMTKEDVNEYDWLSPRDQINLETFYTTSYVDGPFDSPSAAAKGMFERYAMNRREYDNEGNPGPVLSEYFQLVEEYLDWLRTGWIVDTPDVVLGEN